MELQGSLGAIDLLAFGAFEYRVQPVCLVEGVDVPGKGGEVAEHSPAFFALVLGWGVQALVILETLSGIE